METIRLVLPVLLNDDEKVQMGKELAECVQALEQSQEEKKAYNAKIKICIDNNLAEANALSLDLKRGYALRSVECQIAYNYETSTVSTIRLDTGEVVEVRNMRQDELQISLFNNNDDDKVYVLKRAE